MSSMSCMVPQPLATRGNRSCPEFWVITGDQRYPGYRTPIVAPEPSIEWSVKKHPLDGRLNRFSYVNIGSSKGFDDEIVGLKPPRFQLGIPWWCPSCCPRGYV
jgi:hypothetical protein